ncbi:hypothetical protein ACET3Z_001555 [Daucus carota]
MLGGAISLLHGDEETVSTRCDDFHHDCKELFWTSCTVTEIVVGGPVINCYGEVIGVSFALSRFNAFLLINIALKCLEDLKKIGKFQGPYLGMGVANLYTAKLEKLDELLEHSLM